MIKELVDQVAQAMMRVNEHTEGLAYSHLMREMAIVAVATCGKGTLPASNDINEDNITPLPVVRVERWGEYMSDATSRDWRPIESAPRDGTWIAALYSNNLYYEPVIVHWDDDAGPYSWVGRENAYSEGRISLWAPIPPLPEIPD